MGTVSQSLNELPKTDDYDDEGNRPDRIKFTKYSGMKVGWTLSLNREPGESDSAWVKRLFDLDASVRWEAEAAGYTYK